MLLTCTLTAALAGSAQETPPAPTGPARTFEQRLANHGYFSRIALERVAIESTHGHAPYVFLLQRTGKDDPERTSALVQRYVNMLDPALRAFTREVAEPLGLKLRADQNLVVAVLASPGDLDNYARVTPTAEHFEGLGFHDWELNAAVLSEDPFQLMRSRVALSLSARHAFLHVCVQAWSAPGAQPPHSNWVLEALVSELARRDPNEPDVPVPPDPAELRAFLLSLQDETQRALAWRSLEELCTLGEARNLEEFLEQRSLPTARADLEAAALAFRRQALLRLHFLLEGEARRYRPAMLAFVKQALSDRADWASCAQSFEPATGAELDAAFLAWALQTAGASDARSKLDPAAIERALRPEAKAAGPAAAATAPAPESSPAPAAPAPLPILVPALATDLAHGSEEDRLAFALYELGRGRVQAGQEALAALLASTRDATLRSRVEREQRRVAAWVELRDAFLQARVGSPQVIEFTYKGNELKSLVLGYADGLLHLEKERAPEFLSPDGIDPLELATQIEPSGAANDWARLYPYVLQDDPRGRKLLKDDGGEGGALLADARSDYPPRIRLGVFAGRLQELATRKPPTSVAEARKQFESLAAVRREAEGLPLLEAKRNALREHARALLLRTLEGRTPKDFLHGKLTLKGDTLRLTYEFDDPRELEDFSRELYPPRSVKALTPESSGDQPFRVEQGVLVGLGQVSLRSLVDLAAPLTARYTLECREVQAASPACDVALGICDDGQEHFLWAVGLSHLQRYDANGNAFSQEKPDVLFYGRTYAMELRHDGTNATLLCDGKPTQTVTVGQRQAGAFFLCASSDCPVHIQRLELEGRLPPNGLDRLKNAWVERDLVGF